MSAEYFIGILLLLIIVAFVFAKRKKQKIKKPLYTDPKTIIDKLSIDLDLNPNNEIAYYERGKARLKIKDRKGAYKDFCAARDLGFEKANEIIENQFSDLEYKEKLADFESYIHYTPNIDRKKAREYKNQFEDYTKVINANPKSFTAYIMRAGIKEIINDYNGAIEDLNKAILIKHDFADAFTKRGSIKIKLNKTEEAIKDFQVAVKLGSTQAKNLLAKYSQQV